MTFSLITCAWLFLVLFLAFFVVRRSILTQKNVLLARFFVFGKGVRGGTPRPIARVLELFRFSSIRSPLYHAAQMPPPATPHYLCHGAE